VPLMPGLPARGRPPQAAARRAGLEFVEKLHERNGCLAGRNGTRACFAHVPLVASLVDVGYWLELLVTLVVVAVAHRRLGPSSSATTSTMERALLSSAVHARCWSRPTTTTRLPLVNDWLACSAWSRHTTTVKNDDSCSRRPDTATRNTARMMPPSG